MTGRITDFESYFGVSLGEIKAPPYLRVWVQTEEELTYVNITWEMKRLWSFQRLSANIVSKLSQTYNSLGDITLRINRKGRPVIVDADIKRWIRLAKRKKAGKIDKKFNFGWIKNYIERKDTCYITGQMIGIRENEQFYLKTPDCVEFGDIHQLSQEARLALDRHSGNCQFCDYKLYLIVIGRSRDQNMVNLGFDPYDSEYGLSEEEIESLVG